MAGNVSLVLETGRRRVSRKLTLGGRTVDYVNAIPTTGVAQFVRDLARQLGVSYTRTSSDQWAETVTRLAGDESGSISTESTILRLGGVLRTSM